VLRRLVLLVLGMALAGCPPDQTLVVIGTATVEPARIDQQPLDLLPSGALLVGNLDARALFQSSLGPQMSQVVANLLPLGRESNFVAERDVSRVVGGIYAMQGADFVAVVQGNFDIASIEAAARARAATPSGTPLVETRYGTFTLYTVANVGFVPLTQFTIVSGNETGMRRALDRLRYGRLQNDLAPWMSELLAHERAAFVVAGDVGSQGVIEAAAGRLPFVSGLELVRILGNFEEPGMNVVGSLTYRSEEQAQAGAVALDQIRQLAAFASLLAILGFGGTAPAIDVAPQGTSVAFASKIDKTLAQLMLGLVIQATQTAR
jgi:hypothetical protein